MVLLWFLAVGRQFSMFKARKLKSGNFNLQYIEKDEYGRSKIDENGKRIIKSFLPGTGRSGHRYAVE